MLYSRTCRLRLIQMPLVLLVALCLSGQPCLAEPDLLGGDIRLPSSAADNSLIDPDTIEPPAPPRISPAEAADLVRSKVGGQVMSVKTQPGNTGVIYAVKVLNAGRMRVIRVDGQSGHLLNQ